MVFYFGFIKCYLAQNCALMVQSNGFVKLGSTSKPEDGELDIIKFIKPKKIKDKLTRKDLPTDEEIQKILSVCADSTRDKAMLSVHAEAGTRVGELLGLKIKDFTIDKFGGISK